MKKFVEAAPLSEPERSARKLNAVMGLEPG
jgi:hypothetical protein